MFLKQLSIIREGYYGEGYGKADPSKPLKCVVQVEGPLGKVELNLPSEVGERIVAVVADELAAASRAVADTMTSTFVEAVPSLPAE